MNHPQSIIDSHQHVNWHRRDAKGLISARDRYPDRFLLGYSPNPAWPTAPELLANAHHMHGVDICGEWKFRMLIDDPRCIEVFRVAGENRMPVVLHLDVPYLRNETGGRKYQTEWYGGTIDNLARALCACPKTTFIGHAPGFWREISADADEDPKQAPIRPRSLRPGSLRVSYIPLPRRRDH